MERALVLPLLLLCACHGSTVKTGDSGAASDDADGDGYSESQGDCAPDDASAFPGAPEYCDGVDNDCDGQTDEDDALDAASWYPDLDGDGFGNPDVVHEACQAPSAYIADGGDCDDNDAAINPDAEEICDDLDNDCDGETDEAADLSWYLDEDGDGYGSQSSVTACEQPSGTSDNAEDCDDADPATHPGADEACDGVDNDCDGEIDEEGGSDASTWYADDDFDGYGDPDDSLQACEQPSGYVDNAEDCDDGSAGTYPGAEEHCDGEDNDCDGDSDEDTKAGWALVSVDTNAGYVYEIDPTSGSTTTIVAIADSSVGINTMDVREDGTAVVQDHVNLMIHQIDACAGTLTSIGATGVGNMCGISFGPGGVLYGMDTTNDNLVQIDVGSGAGTVIGPLGLDVGNCGLAYDCGTDTLYGADGTSNQVFVLDSATGAASAFVSTGVPFSAVGLELDNATGLLLASTGADLYTVDPATGTTTYMGAMGGSNIDDLAYHPACP